MLLNTAVANLLVALNFLLIGKIGSAFALNLVAIAQTMGMLLHTHKGTKTTTAEKILFLIAYLVLGYMGMITAPGFIHGWSWENFLELMPIAGAVLLMVSVFVRDEQTSRKFGLANALVYFIYDGIVGTTAIFAQLISIVTTSAALFKYRKANRKKEDVSFEYDNCEKGR